MKKLYLLLAILVQVSVLYSQTTHFIKGYTSENPYEPISIVILDAKINGNPLQAGDEIAAFDGNLCVGVLVLDAPIDTTILKPEIIGSADDDPDDYGYINGFQEGKPIYLRIWDKSAEIEYHNIVLTFYDKTTGNPTTASDYSKGGFLFVTAFTATTTKTWIGEDEDSQTSWSVTGNWSPAGIPEPIHDVVIPSGVPIPAISATDMAFCGSLTFQNNPTLNIRSTVSGTGSLIVVSDVSGAGTVASRRYMLGNGWHMVSSPVSGQTAGAFLSDSPNTGVAAKDRVRGMMDYNESKDNWNDYFTIDSTNIISAGKGYSIRRELNSNSYVEFKGSLNRDVTVAVTKSSNGWNLVGNPFPSAIYLFQEVFGFLTVNEAKMDPSFVAAYLWDPVKKNYTIINKDSVQANLASGQGFFIKAVSAGNVTFTKQMQVHQTNASFKSATISKPSIVLNAKVNDFSSSTKISFNEEMTLGLDPGYDAGILRSGNGFDIYSRLVTDNGVDFAIQALPGKSNDSYVIPIGADAIKGGEIVFSAKASNLPSGYEVMLEDKLTSTVTNIKNGELYLANVAAASKGTGRFFLHVGSALQTGIQDIQQNDIVVYSIGKSVYIKGNVSNNTQFAVYSVDGRLINRFGATSQNLNQMSVAGYTPGIYFVNVKDNNKYKSVKFVVGN
jgi:hypothetical protein